MEETSTERHKRQVLLEVVDLNPFQEETAIPKRKPMEDKKRLIECVRQFPHLYDPREKDHHNSLVCQNSWKTIARELGQPSKLVNKLQNGSIVAQQVLNTFYVVDVCKKRWTALRKQYCEIRNGKRGTTGTGAKRRAVWTYYELLSFLDGGIGARFFFF